MEYTRFSSLKTDLGSGLLSPERQIAEITPRSPSILPRLEALEGKADLDDEIVIEEPMNDLCRGGWEDREDRGLDPPEPLDLVWRGARR